MLPRGRAARTATAVYVVTVSALAAAAWSDGPVWTELLAFGLTLPAVVVALPVIYLFGAAAWTTAGSSGAATWEVTATFTVLFALTAMVNVAGGVYVSRRCRSGHPPAVGGLTR